MAFGPRLQIEVPNKNGGDPNVILLAPLSKESVPEFVKNGGLQSYQVSRFLGSHSNAAPVSEDELDWFEKVRKDSNSRVWGVYSCKDGQERLIGNTSLNSFEHDSLGIQATSGVLLFDKSMWGLGIATHIHMVRTWFAFTQLGIVRIKSAVIQGNEGSLAALRRSGYTPVYTERNTVFVDGGWRHQDNLECLNPLPAFWDRWWGDDAPPSEALVAQKTTLEVLDWAKQNVKIL